MTERETRILEFNNLNKNALEQKILPLSDLLPGRNLFTTITPITWHKAKISRSWPKLC